MPPVLCNSSHNITKISVICITDYFLPGFKGGGPIRTLANLCELLAEDLTFSIFTRDRDLGMTEAYPNISANSWSQTSYGQIFYATPDRFSAKGLRAIMSYGEFDVLYLNSFWSYRASISVYLNWRISGRNVAILIAPRGEFSPGALALKRLKKSAFLMLMRGLGLYRHVHWHASNSLEASDILRQFPDAEKRIHIAADPISMVKVDEAPPLFPIKTAGRLKIAFISRISPKKNLDGLIKILGGVQRKVELSIYGPIEDAAYWRKCLTRIDELPDGISVVYHGPVDPRDITATFAAHDIFAFPTHGENFGHVIFEALRAGTPVLLSDQTPWKNSACGALSIASLNAINEWRQKIEQAADRSQEEQDSLRRAALEYARLYAADDKTRSDNLTMFRAVAHSV